MPKSGTLAALLAVLIAAGSAAAGQLAGDQKRGLPPPIAQGQAEGPAGILVAGAVSLDEAELAGLAPGSKPHALTLQEAYSLALIRSRAGEKTQKGARPTAWDATQLADRVRQYDALNFGRFRKDFLAATGDTASAGFHDPAPAFFALLGQLQVIENQQKTVAARQQLYQVFRELRNSEASGITEDQVEHIESELQKAQRDQAENLAKYRDALDALKLQLGLAADLPLIPDRAPVAVFRDVFLALQRWTSNPRRTRADLDGILSGLPALDDVVIEGRSLIATIKTHPEPLADLLAAAARVAGKNRPAQPGARAASVDERVILQIRRQIRQLQRNAQSYDAQRRELAIALMVMDGAQERLIAPPASRSSSQRSSAASQTSDVIAAHSALMIAENALVESWIQYQIGRLTLDRALGAVPYNDWPAFLKSLTATRKTPRAPANEPRIIRPSRP